VQRAGCYVLQMTLRPCKPKQQLYEGQPGATIVCPECQQTLRGIPYAHAIGLLTLPVHYDPLCMKKRFPTLRAERSYRAS
jgi:hypothetical protein